MDLSGGSTGLVLDHQVALGEWSFSFRTEPPYGLRFENMLLLPARVEDTNGDKQIDGDDDAAIFTYDLAQRTRRRLPPAGYSAENVHIFGERLAVLLRRAGEETLSVYVCDPQSGDGRFVAQDLAP